MEKNNDTYGIKAKPFVIDGDEYMLFDGNEIEVLKKYIDFGKDALDNTKTIAFGGATYVIVPTRSTAKKLNEKPKTEVRVVRDTWSDCGSSGRYSGGC